MIPTKKAESGVGLGVGGFKPQVVLDPSASLMLLPLPGLGLVHD